VYYTRDGSLPTRGSASFTGHAQFDMTEDGNHIIACYAPTATAASTTKPSTTHSANKPTAHHDAPNNRLNGLDRGKTGSSYRTGTRAIDGSATDQ
jgi:hypothetical protein